MTELESLQNQIKNLSNQLDSIQDEFKEIKAMRIKKIEWEISYKDTQASFFHIYIILAVFITIKVFFLLFP